MTKYRRPVNATLLEANRITGLLCEHILCFGWSALLYAYNHLNDTAVNIRILRGGKDLKQKTSVKRKDSSLETCMVSFLYASHVLCCPIPDQTCFYYEGQNGCKWGFFRSKTNKPYVE